MFVRISLINFIISNNGEYRRNIGLRLLKLDKNSGSSLGKIEMIGYFSRDYATCSDIFQSNYRDVNTTTGIPVIHSARLWIEGSEPRF